MILKHIADPIERKKYAIQNKELLIKLKKAEKKLCASVHAPADNQLFTDTLKDVSFATKAVDTDAVINRSFIGNTYYWLDNHGDVHVKGCFKQSIKQNKTGILHLHDHKNEVTATVGIISDVAEITLDWQQLGIKNDGSTVALVANSDIYKDLNASVFFQYSKGVIQQHSVGMYYTILDFAVNDPSDEQGFKAWNEVYPMLGNKEEADKYGFFFVVREAKLVEISAVTQGSNELTYTFDKSTDTETIIKNLVKSGESIENLLEICSHLALESKPPQQALNPKSSRRRAKFLF